MSLPIDRGHGCRADEERTEEREVQLTDSSHGTGAGFLNTLACHQTGSKLFTAIATHSGTFYINVNGTYNDYSVCTPGKRLPIMEIHGAKDNVVPHNGSVDDSGTQLAIQSWLARWAKRNHCRHLDEREISHDEVLYQEWECSGISGFVKRYLLKDSGKFFVAVPRVHTSTFFPFLPDALSFLMGQRLTWWLRQNTVGRMTRPKPTSLKGRDAPTRWSVQMSSCSSSSTDLVSWVCSRKWQVCLIPRLKTSPRRQELGGGKDGRIPAQG